MNDAIIDALLSDGLLKTAEDAEAAGRIAARAYAAEWARLSGIFKGAQEASADEEEDDEGEDEEAEEEAGEGEEEKKGQADEAEADDDEGEVSPEDIAWLVENLGV